ncbi:MAG: deoxyuridine 5'-triphosphate nucleotidohydrolase [Oscillospiraceae bacterium]|nr:deoxyuridine 5'-triphosphate nucleotidohydrolase [Oscillospiraceae bacterium]
MHRIAEFEAVSFTQFKMGAESCQVPLYGERLQQAYQKLMLPARATTGSAGYDFYSPFSFSLSTRETITIPTGIRVKIEPGWWLGLLPRSGHGFRYRIQLDNTMGVIDSDYYNAENEGHIMVKLTNDSLTGKHLRVNEGDSFVQGIFLPYGITVNDKAEGARTGGFGSTDR